MAEARIPKREAEICQRLIELYEMRMLNVSYEIRYVRSDVVIKDSVLYVDASENNFLTGMCVVSVPAYPESTARSLIAEELTDKPDDKDVEDELEMEDDKEENEGADKMTLEEAMSTIAQKDQMIAELEGKVAAAEKNAEDIENEKKAKDTELAQKDEDKKKVDEELVAAQESIASKDQEIASKDQTIAELEAKVAELEPMKAELENMKAEKEAAILAEKQNKAKSFAERLGLDVENDDVKNAIASLNYEALASLDEGVKPSAEEKITLASFAMTSGMEIDDKYGDLLNAR